MNAQLREAIYQAALQQLIAERDAQRLPQAA